MDCTVQEVLAGTRQYAIVQGDCIERLREMPADSVDVIFGSPPYMDARTYGIEAARDCQAWVDWMLDVTTAAVRVSKGLVLWVVAGVQRELCYWPGCEGLTWEWWKRGNQLWRPCIWWKVDDDDGGSGIPGSGGKQWLRNDWEYVLAFKKDGWLPWANPLALGHEPVYDQVGGEMSNRLVDGKRINQRWGGSTRAANGEMQAGSKDNARDRAAWGGKFESIGNRAANGKRKHKPTMDVTAGHDNDGNTGRADGRPMPKIANPGNCIIVKARVGGGHMGSALCHENEAPFPEKLAEFFVLSFCPEGGVILDTFSGSGTTAAVAYRHGRRAIGLDLRQSQVDLGLKRLANETPLSLLG